MHMISFLHMTFASAEFCSCSPQKPAPLHFHYISICSQFVRTDSCLSLWRRQSENIEPAHSNNRQHHQHNSDSSKKMLDEQSLQSTFYFSSHISAAKRIWRRGAQVSEWMVLMIIHAVTCCWKTFKTCDREIDYVFSRGRIDWSCKR